MIEENIVVNQVFSLLVPPFIMGCSSLALRYTLYGSRYVGSDISFGIAIGFFVVALKESFCEAITKPFIYAIQGEISQLIILSMGILAIVTGVIMLFCEGRLDEWQIHGLQSTRPLDRRGALFFFTFGWFFQILLIAITFIAILYGIINMV